MDNNNYTPPKLLVINFQVNQLMAASNDVGIHVTEYTVDEQDF